MLELLYKFSMTDLCQTFMITLFTAAQNVLLWPVRRHKDALSINCAINTLGHFIFR